MKRIILSSAFPLVFCAPLAAAIVQKPAGDGGKSTTVDYVVRKGDNLYTLANRYFERPADFETVRRLNHVPDPRRLRVGSTLHIPRPVLREQLLSAHVETFSGPVRLGMSGHVGTPTVGMPVVETTSIETGANAFVTLRLADGSTVSVPSQSHVTVQRMRKVLLTGAVERLFDIEAGRVRAAVTPMTNADSSFRLATPIAIAAVRGTQFQVGYDPTSQADTTEVLEGKVGVDGTKTPSSQLVPAGFGMLASASGGGPLVKLLPAPKLVDPGRIQSGEQLSFTIAPLEGAKAYHVEIARDADILDQVEELRSDTPAVTLASVPTGTYFVRASAIDGNGLEGVPAIYGFERRLNTVEGGMDNGKAGHVRQYRFRWYAQGEGARQFRFQLSTHADGSAPVIDEMGLADPNITITNLPSGDYYWRVMSVQFADGKASGAWSPIHQFHIETH